MPEKFDVAVIGLGAMGSAAACHLARRGLKVLGIDQFQPPHTLGSSHGQSRIIREAYYEHPAYVPLVRRAYELWRELERESGSNLLLETGGLMIGPSTGTLVEGAKKSADTHSLPHEMYDARALREKFPMFVPPDNAVAVHEPRAGVLYPEACIAAHLQVAQKGGALLRTDEKTLRWKASSVGVEITTEKERYLASKVIFSAGAWLMSLVPGLRLPSVVERQTLFWFRTSRPEMFQPSRCPIYMWEYGAGQFFYGFPDLGTGVKVAKHHEGELTHPDNVNRSVTAQEVESMREVLRERIPAIDGPLVEATVCIYTNTPDGHFLIDWHPGHPEILIASPCSGHGFKFSSAIGEALADLAMEKSPRVDLDLFRWRWS